MMPAQRVSGWDLLRGMCALAVASYHLMYWQGIAGIHTLGSYGVYLFFVLSGASLAYNYVDKIQAKRFSWGEFLWVRYLRLAPLYLLLMLIALPWKLIKEAPAFDLIRTYVLNATFLFGFFNPSQNAALVGGWSLGIEAIFYLLFPLMMFAFRSAWLAAGLFSVLLVLQISWIAWSFSDIIHNPQAAVAYFQAPAFVAYFMGGCTLGVMKRQGFLKNFQASGTGLIGVSAGFVLMVLVNPMAAGHEIVGWRGFLLGLSCFVMVYCASCTAVSGELGQIAKYFGDATYGVYLIHPVLFFGLVQVVFPRLGIASPVHWPITGRLLFGCLIIGLAFWLALLSERYFEARLRNFLKPRRLKADVLQNRTSGSH